MSLDTLDARLLTLMCEKPSISVVELASVLGVARATAQARLDRLKKRGVIASTQPHIDPAALGYSIRVTCLILIHQTVGHKRVAEGLAQIPEVVSLYTVTGEADMMATVVARSTTELQQLLDRISTTEGVARSSSRLVLETHMHERLLPLVHEAVTGNTQPN